jgi:hypothetical protein
MPIDAARVRDYLRTFDFRNLFIEELGWNRPAGRVLDVEIDGRNFRLDPAAEKLGVQIFICAAGPDGAIPDYATQRKIEKAVAKLAHEHLIIFTDKAKTTQVWQWVARAPGRPAAYRHHTWHKDQPGDALMEKLKHISFTLDEEESLTLTGATLRLKDAFDRERVTKRFYELFKREHEAFIGFIEGLESLVEREWYASIMLNRLMFIWFVQKKGFLDNNVNYLRDKLAEVQSRHGKGKFHSFYRLFLLRLFHEGLGKRERDRTGDLAALIGKVPYLNGGLFDVHALEHDNKNIEIPDSAFERVFGFFEAYQWHLDDRPLANDSEINPDVLGYIFEKYINQKQMGAYYTKEDITEYITKNTVIPFLLDATRAKCKIAFEGETSAWKLLANDPDRYIYEPVRRGVVDAEGKVISEAGLPVFVQQGMRDPKARMFDKRYNLGAADIRDAADRQLALPTETWREYIARRERCLTLRDKLRAGEVRDINDLITLNLNIRQFAQDVIESAEGPELVRAFWHAIVGRIPKKSNETFQHGITVLDPTCGSGAFLFAALNILEELYEACLDRMEAFVAELDRGEKRHTEKYADFRDVLAQVAKHPSRKYYIYKTIILNNLYGVDIMPEAVEIAKLRLFLKLVAQLERADQIEPLPDIDFNIRAGNTLVGYATEEDVRKACQGGAQTAFDFGGDYERFRDKLETLNSAFELFRRQQTEKDGYVTADDKRQLRERLRELEEELNLHLAGEYGVDLQKKTEYQKWLASHQPFHWFIEFFSIMRSGGFSVIIGNPPWREYSAVRQDYTVRGYRTEPTGNLYAMCSERSLVVRAPRGRFSFIVQLPLVSSSRMAELRILLREKSSPLWFIPFDDRPGKLFEALQHCRATIFVSRGREGGEGNVFGAWYQRWPSATRDTLFSRIRFVKTDSTLTLSGELVKESTPIMRGVLQKVLGPGNTPIAKIRTREPTKHFIFYQEATQYWTKATSMLPYYSKNKTKGPPAHGRHIYFDSAAHAAVASAVLNSSIFYLYFIAYSDCFHLSDALASAFPVPNKALTNPSLVRLNDKLMEALKEHAERKTIRTRSGDVIVYDEYYASKCKPIIDEIDHALGKLYGLGEQELDFVTNYDIGFRLSGDAEEAEDI